MIKKRSPIVTLSVVLLILLLFLVGLVVGNRFFSKEDTAAQNHKKENSETVVSTTMSPTMPQSQTTTAQQPTTTIRSSSPTSATHTTSPADPDDPADLFYGYKTVADMNEYEQPSCQGEYILIVDEVRITEGVLNEPTAVKPVLKKYPGSRVTKGGACPSLEMSREDSQGREFYEAGYDGGYIVPIFYNYANDREAACAARDDYSNSKVRQLTNIDGDYNDPC